MLESAREVTNFGPHTLQILDPIGRADRRSSAIHRRVYNVPAPNCLWQHKHSNHKFKCATNNQAATALERKRGYLYFKEGVAQYDLPSRVHGDCGVENWDEARVMVSSRGTDRGSFMTGNIVHNTIERVWKEVNRVVTHHYSSVDKHMQHQ